MANEKLLKLVQQGRGEFVKWRTKHPKVILDLMDAQLPEIDLRGANLRRADLIGVNLTGGNLAGAFLTGGDLTRSKLAGINLKGADLSGALFAFADLSGADLSGANLKGADLSRAELAGANLSDARLDAARLTDANLKGADLSGATLKRAELGGAQLTGSTLCYANFTEAGLNGARLDEADATDAILNRTHVKGAQFHETRFGWTSLGNVDFSGALGLDKILHLAPSSLGVDTLLRSRGGLPAEFLRGCGVPADWSTQFSKPEQLPAAPVCFLSFSEPDRPIAELLQKALAADGVYCWLHAKPEERVDWLPDLFERRGDLWDKLLLCASTNSLRSWWVDDEISAVFEREEMLTKQRGTETEVLVPLIVDGYIQGGNWQGVHTKRVYERLKIDFSRCRRDKGRFAEEIGKVIRTVRGEEDPSGGAKKKGK